MKRYVPRERKDCHRQDRRTRLTRNSHIKKTRWSTGDPSIDHYALLTRGFAVDSPTATACQEYVRPPNIRRTPHLTLSPPWWVEGTEVLIGGSIWTGAGSVATQSGKVAICAVECNVVLVTDYLNRAVTEVLGGAG